jgi:four helix bundle protein
VVTRRGKSRNWTKAHLKSETPKFQIEPTRAELDVLFRPAVAADPRKADEIHQRLINFGARTTRVAKMLPRTMEGRYISQQLLRCGLATASNYAEARAAESRADFVHKLRIVLKELNESRSWLEQIVANNLVSRDKMAGIIAESKELCWIMAASIKTARGPRCSI